MINVDTKGSFMMKPTNVTPTTFCAKSYIHIHMHTNIQSPYDDSAFRESEVGAPEVCMRNQQTRWFVCLQNECAVGLLLLEMVGMMPSHVKTSIKGM